MKRSLIMLFLLLCTSSCAPPARTIEKKTTLRQSPPPREVAPIPVQHVEELDTKEAEKSRQQYSEFLSNVAVSISAFNPQKGEEIAIYYSLSRRAKTEVAIYDPDFMLIRTFKSDGLLEVGKHNLNWDGKDMDSNVVPDEAYFFTITAEEEKGDKYTYDPTTFSGGEGTDITEVNIDPDTKIITYKLPVSARVLIRLGVHDGPLLNTLVDWKPRIAGEINEYWNGRDQDKIIDLLNHPRFKMLITYFTLPENSIITYGNSRIDYREYKNSLKTQRPTKERTTPPDIRISPHYQLPRTVDYSPKLKVSLSNVKEYDEKNVPVLQGKTLVTVEIDEADKSFFINQQYEITLFLDSEFYAEQEVGYAPFNWVWDLSDVKEGEHVLTINMSGFRDQMGIWSERIRVIK